MRRADDLDFVDSMFDEPTARDLRDQALEQVLDNSGTWQHRARARVREIGAGWTGTGEAIRLMLEDEGLVPHHHNAWGGLINGCVRAGWLVWVEGKLDQMRTLTSHARSTKVYRRTERA